MVPEESDVYPSQLENHLYAGPTPRGSIVESRERSLRCTGNSPTEMGIEQAMTYYTSSVAGASEWRAVSWLWDALPWSARIITHVGAATLEWWKRKYVLPLLCQAAVPFLERFARRGVDEEKGRRWFFFFSPIAVAAPQLFPPELVAFLSDAGRSFCRSQLENRPRDSMVESRGRSVRRKNDSPTVQQHSPKESCVEVSEQVPQKRIPVSEETKEAAHRLVGKMNQARESVAACSESMDKTFRRAFPMRREIEQTMADIQKFQEELFLSLAALDDGIFYLSESALGTEEEAREIIHREEGIFDSARTSLPTLESRTEEIRSRVDDLRNSLFTRLHDLVRSLDCLSLLDPSAPMYSHQSRVVREARDHIKKFRLALAKGPGPEISLAQLEKFVDQRIGLSEEFHTAAAT